MKKITGIMFWVFLSWSVLLSQCIAAETSDTATTAKQLKVVVVTGGHPFNKDAFLSLFQGYDDITYEHKSQKLGGELFEDISDWPYDVIVLYNFAQKITPKQQQNLVHLLEKGVGLLVLHHANDAYPDWKLYQDISGVESHFGPWEKEGVAMKPSGFTGGRKFRVHVEDKKHPITKDLEDYDFQDETYCRRTFRPDIHVLLTTDEPTSDKPLAWVKTFRKARVCYLQSGHAENAYRNSNYRTLVSRAIRWVAQ